MSDGAWLLTLTLISAVTIGGVLVEKWRDQQRREAEADRRRLKRAAERYAP